MCEIQLQVTVYLAIFGVLLSDTLVLAFYPNNLYQCPGVDNIDHLNMDHTHRSITKLAISSVIKDILSDNSLSGTDSKTTQRQALEEIMMGSDELDKYGYDKAAYHFNGDQLTQGNDKLRRWRREIIELSLVDSPYKYQLIRHVVGQSLHLIQDFYSNTAWVDKFKDPRNLNSSYSDLGQEGKEFLRVFNFDSCQQDVVNSASGNPNNILHGDNYISSGYRAGQDIVKPPGRYSTYSETYQGKCSHGGMYDSSGLEAPTGGINSESNSYWLSPKYQLHNSSAVSALQASKAFLYSVGGLSQNVTTPELLRILGVAVPQHVSLLYTHTMREMTQSGSKWDQTLLSTTKPWPWDHNHLYTRGGEKTSRDVISLYGADSLLDSISIEASQYNILLAALSLPEYSHLIVIMSKEEELPDGWNEDTLKKVLNQRNIRLIIFVRQSSSDGNQGVDLGALDRLCKSTQGHLFMINNADDVLGIMKLMKPSWHTTNYIAASDGTVMIPLQPRQTVSLVINCMHPQTESHRLPTGSLDSGTIISTGYTSILNITSRSLDTQLAETRLPMSLIDKCSVSTWSEDSVVNVYAVQERMRAQLFAEPIRVLDKSRFVVESMSSEVTPVSLTDSRQSLNLTTCMFETARPEVDHTYLSDILKNSRQPDYIDVNMKMGLYNMTVREYIDTQHVQIDAWRVLSANASSLNISIHNKWDRSSLSFEIYPRGLSGITMIADYQASYGEQFNIQLLFDESIEKHRPITFLLSGAGDDLVKFYAAHTFYFLNADHRFYTPSSVPTKSTKATTTASTAKPTTRTSTVKTNPTTPSSKVTRSSNIVTVPNTPPIPKETAPDLFPPATTIRSRPGNLVSRPTPTTQQSSQSGASTTKPNIHIPNSLTSTTYRTVRVPTDKNPSISDNNRVEVVTVTRYNEAETPHLLALSFVITVLVLVTLIVVTATAILLYNVYYRDKHPLDDKECKYATVPRDVPVTSL